MPPTIAIVDADPTAAQITRRLVQHLVPDATVTCERSPEQSWNTMQTQTPDVLIIDPASFGPAGALLIRLCRETWRSMIVIALASGRQSRHTAQLGADAYIDKTSDPIQLNDALRHVLA